MKIRDHGASSNQSQHGLTLLEVFLVIAIIAVLAALLLPMRPIPDRAPRIRCLNNVRQISIGLVADAMDNHDQLPSAPEGSNRLPWDVPWDPFERIQHEGLARDILYDSVFKQQNDDRLWNAATNQYRTIGYALALAGPGSTLITSNQATTITNAADFSLRVIVADSIISLSGQTDPKMTSHYQWKNIPGGLPTGAQTASGKWQGFSSSFHPAGGGKVGTVPQGGNVAFLDGHAKWRPFSEMQPRTTGTNRTPVFWW